MKMKKKVLVSAFVLLCMGLEACASGNTVSSPVPQPENQAGLTTSVEPTDDALDEIRRAAGVVEGAESAQGMDRLSVKNGTLYRGDTPVDTTITELNLSGLNFDDWSFLADFSGLELLNISTADPEAYKMLKELKTLKTLLIENYPNKTLDEIKACTGLEHLIIAKAPELDDISALSELMYLKELNLSDVPNPLDTGELSGWEDLNLLKLSYVTISSVDFLSECPALQTLHLQGVEGIEDYSSITGLQSLNVLNIVFTPFTQIEVLKDLKSLTSLNLIGTGLESFLPIADYGLPLERFLSDATEEELAVLKMAYPSCSFD